VILKIIGLKIMYLIKIILIWISAYNINEKQVFYKWKMSYFNFYKTKIWNTNIYGV
jgi:hypothetical protein